MYSEESIAETLTAQAEVLANGVLGYVEPITSLIQKLSVLRHRLIPLFTQCVGIWTHLNSLSVFFKKKSFYSVNFKKNEKAYNSEGSEVLKALKETENDPREPGKLAKPILYIDIVNCKCPLECMQSLL